MEANPWTDITEAQRWVDRKHAQHESTATELSRCEYMSTTVVTFICCTILHVYRAIMVTAVASSAKRFHWNSLGEITLLLMDHLGYLSVQAPIGYICDNRSDVICSRSGIDRINGEKALTSAVERTIGGVIFGSNERDPLDEQLDQIDGSLENDVSGDAGKKAKSKSKLWRRFNKLKKHMAAQYTKYGPRYVLGAMFIFWSILQLIYGVINAVSNQTTLIYLFFIFRFIGGALEGGIMVATQALVGKEVIPNRTVEHSQVIGLSYPIGCVIGILLRVHFSDKYGVHGDCLTWVSAISLLYSVGVFVWLAGSIDESIDRSDLLQKKDDITKERISDVERDSTCKACSRGIVRISVFSYFESIWLIKFRPIISMFLINLLYWFAVHTVTSWIPSRVHEHKDFMTEVLATHILNRHAAAPNESGLSPEDVAKAEKVLKHGLVLPSDGQSVVVKGSNNEDKVKHEEVKDEDEDGHKDEDGPADGGEHADSVSLEEKLKELKALRESDILDEAAYKRAVEKVLDADLNRKLSAIEHGLALHIEKIYTDEDSASNLRRLDGVAGLSDADLALINKSVLEALQAQQQKLEAEGDQDAEKVEEDVEPPHEEPPSIHNVQLKKSDEDVSLALYPTYMQYKDGSFDIGAAKMLPMYLGMLVSSVIGNAFTSFLHRNRYVGPKGSRSVPMAIGMLAPAGLFLYSGIALTNLSNINDLEFDQIFNRASGVFASAIAISGLCLGTLISSQCHCAPFKTGGTFAVINSGAGIGILAAVLYRTLITHLYGDYILLTSMVSAGCFVLAFLIWLIGSSYEIEEELAPMLTDGSPSKRLKVYK